MPREHAPIRSCCRPCCGNFTPPVSPTIRSPSSSRLAPRPSTEQEKRTKLGDDIVDVYTVIDHDPWTPGNLVTVLEHESGVPFQINRLAAECDLLIATGIVEPHQYAGFSGGGKTIAIGCANEAVIEYTHGPALLDDPPVSYTHLTLPT